jgi:zinc transport system substrate-binding protein
MNRKRMIRAAAILMLAVFVLAGCRPGTALEEGKVNIVASFFPLYDFVREIGGEHVHAVNLIPTGVEPHDWAPRSQDMTNVANAQMFVYQGAGFEGWTDDLLGGINRERLVVVEASHGIELIPTSEEDGHDHDDGHYDPHTWLSPKSALKMAENVKNGLLAADPVHSADYERNYEALVAKLKELDAEFTKQLNSAPRKEIVVTHQAFGYLTRDYGLTQLPLMGVAAEAEPTAQDLKRISEYVKEHRIRYIFTEALVSDALPKALARDLNVETLQLHPLEGLTEDEQNSGESYISLMERNLANLVKALSDTP